MANELNLQAKWYNAHRDATAVQEVIDKVADNYTRGSMSDVAYTQIMLVLGNIRDEFKDEAEQYKLLQALERKGDTPIRYK